MNENFLQDNPLKLFDDFVQIPDQAFEDGRDITEINSLNAISLGCPQGVIQSILRRLIIQNSEGQINTVYSLAMQIVE